MPRVNDGYSDPHDFCARCFPSEPLAQRRFGAGEGPDGRGNCFGYDDDHPPYEDTDYLCERCGRELTEKDN